MTAAAAVLARDRLTWWGYGVVASLAFVLNGFGPVLDDLRDELGVSRTVAGLHSTGLAAGVLVAGAVGEWVRRRAGWTGLYWAGTLSMLAGVLVLAAGATPGVTIPAAAAIGLGGTLLLVMIPAVFMVRHGAASGAAVSEAHATASLLGVLAPLLVGLSLAVSGSWLPALLLVALVSLPLLGALAPPLPQGTAAGPDAAPRRLPRAYWRWWTALLFGVATEFAIIVWAADDAQERLGLSLAASAVAPAAFLVGMAVARGRGGRLLLRRPPAVLFRASVLVAVAGFLVFRATDTVAVALAGLVGIGLGVGMLYPASLAAAMRASPGAEARASTRSALASGIAIGGGPLVLGALADATSISTAIWVVPALLLAAGAAAGAR